MFWFEYSELYAHKHEDATFVTMWFQQNCSQFLLVHTISTAKMQTFISFKVLHFASQYIYQMFMFVYLLGHSTWQWITFKIKGIAKYFVCDLFPDFNFCRRLCGDMLISVEDLLFARKRIEKKSPIGLSGYMDTHIFQFRILGGKIFNLI